MRYVTVRHVALWQLVEKTEINYIFWRFHISFISYSVLGEIGSLHEAPPQHFLLTGGETIGGVSNSAVATRPVPESCHICLQIGTYWVPQM